MTQFEPAKMTTHLYLWFRNNNNLSFQLLNEFHDNLGIHGPNFPQSAIVVQSASHILVKQVDLIYKGLLAVSGNLSETSK